MHLDASKKYEKNVKKMRHRPDFYEIKCAAGKTSQTKCAADQIS